MTSHIFSAMPALGSGVLNTGWNVYIPFRGHNHQLRAGLKTPTVWYCLDLSIGWVSDPAPRHLLWLQNSTQKPL